VQYFSLQPGDMGVLGSPAFAHNLTSPDNGSPRFQYEFWFKNQANKDKFAVNPWKYAPKNGGFCSCKWHPPPPPPEAAVSAQLWTRPAAAPRANTLLC
jgi:hypothetical protein